MADELLSQAELETLFSKAALRNAADDRSPPQTSPAPHAAAFRAAIPAARVPLASLLEAGQLAMLRARHESFGRKLSAALSAWLRLVVEVRLHAVDASPLAEMTGGAEQPMFCQLLRAAPLAQRCVVELPLDVLYFILDRLLGGGREPALAIRRPPTEIELRLAARVTALIVAELQAAWQGMLDLQLSADRVETDEGWLSTAARSEPMLVFAFEVKLSDARGVMRLALPVVALAHMGQSPVRPDAKGRDAVAPGSAQPASEQPPPSRGVGSLPGSADGSIELAVRLADTTITARDLEQLQPGDIVATEQPADGLVDVYQNGVLAYQAQLGAYQGRRAIEICRAFDDPGTTPHE